MTATELAWQREFKSEAAIILLWTISSYLDGESDPYARQTTIVNSSRLALEGLGWSINWRGRLSRSQCVSVQTRAQVIHSTYPFCRAHILV